MNDGAAVREEFRFDDALIAAQPTPIAHALRHLSDAAAKDGLLALWQACDAVELLLRIVATMIFADLVRRHDMAARLEPTLREFNFRRPTLGQWKALLMRQLETIGSDPALLAQMPMYRPLVRRLRAGLYANFFDGRGRPETDPPYARAFTDLRNRLAHGAGITPEAGDILVDLWKRRIRGFLRAHGRWGRSLAFYGRDGTQAVLLRGLAPQAAADAPAFERAPCVDDGGRVIDLWPLMLYGVPQVPGVAGLSEADRAIQIYSSTDAADKRVFYTPIGCANPVAHWSVADTEGTDAFFAVFRFLAANENRKPHGAIESFRQEIVADAKLMMGRQGPRDAVLAQVRSGRHRLLWLHGQAGSGKSMLLAKVASRLFDDRRKDAAEAGVHPVVVPYRFRVGDRRCNRTSFLELVRDALAGLVDQHAWDREGASDAEKDPLYDLKRLLRHFAKSSTRLLFVFDGLDEINLVDPEFIDEVLLVLVAESGNVPPAPEGQRIAWLLAGRGALTSSFEQAGAHLVFGAGGLPRMEFKDVRAMILDQIGAKRIGLLENDRSETEVKGSVAATRETLKALDEGRVPGELLAVCKGPDAATAEGKAVATRASNRAVGATSREQRWLIDDDDDQEMYIAVRAKDGDRIVIHSDRVHSEFIATVTARAEGLPLYVKLVIDDIREGTYHDFLTNSLPDSLEQYFERLLNRERLGGAWPLRTPIVHFLAIARAAITFDQLEETVVANALPRAKTDVRRRLLREALDTLSSSLVSTRLEGGKYDGYGVCHQRLREFINPEEEQDRTARREPSPWLEPARDLMAAHCLAEADRGTAPPTAFTPYAVRFGVGHLLELHRYADAMRLLRRLIARSDALASSAPLPGLARETAVALANALRRIDEHRDDGGRDDDGGNERADLLEALAAIDAQDLRSLIGQTYETGLYVPAIRLLIMFHLEHWERELGERMKSPYDVVFRHDAGEAYGEVWLNAGEADRPRWMALVVDMARDATSPHRREIAGYALKTIVKVVPDALEPGVLERYADSASIADRMVAGELVLSLAIGGRDAPTLADRAAFWNPHWPYLRVDIDEVRVTRMGANLDDAPGDSPDLRACKAVHRYADALRRSLAESAFFRQPAHEGLRPLLGDTAAQLAYIERLDHHIPALGRALDVGQHAPVDDLLRLLMCHPLWNVAEAASSAAAALIVRNEARRDLVDRLLATDPAQWRVRYGVVDTAFNIGGTDQYATFRRVLLASHDFGHDRVHGLCADDFLGWLRLADDATRQRICDDPALRGVIHHWVRSAADSWLLEYTYLILRFVQECVDAGTLRVALSDLVPVDRSPHFGDGDFVHLSPDAFLARIEALRGAAVA